MFRGGWLLTTFRDGLFHDLQGAVCYAWLKSIGALTEVVGARWSQEVWSRGVVWLNCHFLRMIQTWKTKRQSGRVLWWCICRCCGRHYQGQGLRMRQCTQLMGVDGLVKCCICCQFEVLHYLPVSLVFRFLICRWIRWLIKVWSFLDNIYWNFMPQLILIANLSIRKFGFWLTVSWVFTLVFSTSMNASLWLTS